MMWVMWLATSLISAASGVVISRRYLKSNPNERGQPCFYQAVAGLNYVLFAFSLMVMAWYAWALGSATESMWFWLQSITCVMNVCVAVSTLRKAKNLQDHEYAHVWHAPVVRGVDHGI